MAKPKAYSYVRWSTPEQERGDSFRRQRALAERYCADHGLELDGRSFRDLGISGFRGANVRTGALGAFMHAIDDGLISAGSYLLVESFDRVSRQDPWDALPTFQCIINAGITLVTLQDSRVYTMAGMKENPLKIMESLLIMWRANEESQMKSSRGRAVWVNKRSRMTEAPLTAQVPAWLAMEPKRRLAIVPDRAAVVRRIFDLTLDGLGQHATAARLNSEGVPTFGRSKHWHRSYVCKILGNAAVMGDYAPHVIEYTNGQKRRRPLDIVRDYYPAVVPRDVFARVQGLRIDRKTPHTRTELKSIVAGLARCPSCGSTMTRVAKGPNGGVPRLTCTTVKRGGPCDCPSVKLPIVEDAIIRGAGGLQLQDVGEAIGVSRGERDGIKSRLAEIEARITRVTEAIETGATPDALEDRGDLSRMAEGADAARASIQRQREGKLHLPHLTARAHALEALRQETLAELAQHEARLNAVDEATIRARLRELREALSVRPLDYPRANVSLRSLFSRIEVDGREEELRCHWTLGGHTVLALDAAREPLNG